MRRLPPSGREPAFDDYLPTVTGSAQAFTDGSPASAMAASFSS